MASAQAAGHDERQLLKLLAANASIRAGVCGMGSAFAIPAREAAAAVSWQLSKQD